MDKIKCEVIRDLMPLVADDVASAESKELVDGHMESCETCKAYYAGMTAQLARTAVPEDRSAFVDFSHRMEKRVRMKKVLIALTAAIVALCVVVVGGLVVYDRMNTYDLMSIDGTQAWLTKEKGGVSLQVWLEDDCGWYDHVSLWREGDIMYIGAYEPELKLWNLGKRGGWYELSMSELLWEEDQLYYYYEMIDDHYDVETDSFINEVSEFKIPLRLVRWGSSDNYTTIYEQGDVLLTYAELKEQIGDAAPDEVETSATAVPSVTMVPVVTPEPEASMEAKLLG